MFIMNQAKAKLVFSLYGKPIKIEQLQTMLMSYSGKTKLGSKGTRNYFPFGA